MKYVNPGTRHFASRSGSIIELKQFGMFVTTDSMLEWLSKEEIAEYKALVKREVVDKTGLKIVGDEKYVVEQKWRDEYGLSYMQMRPTDVPVVCIGYVVWGSEEDGE